MQPARIAELLEPFLGLDHQKSLTPDDLRRISMHIDILRRWNARFNLTSIRIHEEIVTRHFGESLFAARRLFPSRGRHGEEYNDKVLTENLADIGSGAGFPGIPIKLWAPHVPVTLIESNHKKATFLREVARSLTLTDIDIKTARAESLTGGTFDTVTLRAVERYESILPTAVRLLKPTGRLALLIGSAQLLHIQSILPNLSWSESYPVPGSRSRVMVVGRTYRSLDP